MTNTVLQPEPPHPGLGGPDRYPLTTTGRQLIRLLRDGVSLERIAAIGRYRRSWTSAEVLWAKRRYIDHDPDDRQFIPSGFDQVQVPPFSPQVVITARQAEVLDGLCRGLWVPQIAAELGLSQNTVERYIRQTIRLMGAEDVLHAVTLAQGGWVRLIVAERRGGHSTSRKVA
jgi:DNA-binding CsgD family transcriptional regulator